MNFFILIIVIHFLADFALQTHEQATKKSESNTFLFYHVFTYSFVWFLVLLGLSYTIKMSFIFFIITFITHFITDYFTSRIGKPFWKNNDYHNGFVVVGFDQILHYIQLIYTFNFISLLSQFEYYNS